MKTDMSVAVIVPFYNGSKWIERCLESIVNQTVPADEIIVVNDGSTDSERDFLEALTGHYDITVVDKANGGQGSARNAGVMFSTSKFICFLDQDDMFLPDHIEVLLDAVPQNDSRLGWVYGDAMEADGDGNIIRTAMVEAHSSHPKCNIFDIIGRDMFVLPSASLISREAFDAVGGFDEQFMGYEDDDLFMRLFRAGFSNHFVPKPVYIWCIHSESTSFSMKMVRSRHRYFQKLLTMFPDDTFSRRYYFRDCMMPRFGRAFIADVLKARIAGQDCGELLSILRFYVMSVLRNPSVGVAARARAIVALAALSHAPLPPRPVLRLLMSLKPLRRVFAG